MEELKMIIAGNIGKLRREAGMTQLELAETLNYSDKAVSKWERNLSKPEGNHMAQLVELLELSREYLPKPERREERSRLNQLLRQEVG